MLIHLGKAFRDLQMNVGAHQQILTIAKTGEGMKQRPPACLISFLCVYITLLLKRVFLNCKHRICVTSKI